MTDRVLRSLVPRRRWAWGLLARLIFVCQRLPVLCARLQLRLSCYACMRHPGLLLLLHISDLLATSTCPTVAKSSNDERRASPWSTDVRDYIIKKLLNQKIAMAQTATAAAPTSRPQHQPPATWWQLAACCPPGDLSTKACPTATCPMKMRSRLLELAMPPLHHLLPHHRLLVRP